MLFLQSLDPLQGMERQIARVIEANELDFLKVDHNVAGQGAGAKTTRHGYAENGYWRYCEAVYGIFGRLRARFPDLILQNCAGGGGRTDVGQMGAMALTRGSGDISLAS